MSRPGYQALLVERYSGYIIAPTTEACWLGVCIFDVIFGLFSHIADWLCLRWLLKVLNQVGPFIMGKEMSDDVRSGWTLEIVEV